MHFQGVLLFEFVPKHTSLLAPSPVPESPVRRLDDLNLDDDID